MFNQLFKRNPPPQTLTAGPWPKGDKWSSPCTNKYNGWIDRFHQISRFPNPRNVTGPYLAVTWTNCFQALTYINAHISYGQNWVIVITPLESLARPLKNSRKMVVSQPIFRLGIQEKLPLNHMFSMVDGFCGLVQFWSIPFKPTSLSMRKPTCGPQGEGKFLYGLTE